MSGPDSLTHMQRAVYAVDERSGHLRTVAEAPLHRAAADEAARWIDVGGFERDQLIELAAAWSLSEAAADALLSPGQRALVVPHSEVVIARLQYVEELDAPRARSLTLLHFERTLATLHAHAAPALDEFAREFAADTALVEASAAGVLASLVEAQVEHSIGIVLEYRSRVLEIEEDIASGSRDDSDLGASTAHLKRLGLRLLTCVEDQYWCARSLERSSGRLTSRPKLLPVLANAIANAEGGMRSLERLQRRLAEARSELQLRIQDRTDARIQILTVLSAVFLPLTLITGIYGMNFEGMPELASPFGYPVTLAAMGLIAAGLVALFRVRRWF